MGRVIVLEPFAAAREEPAGGRQLFFALEFQTSGRLNRWL